MRQKFFRVAFGEVLGRRSLPPFQQLRLPVHELTGTDIELRGELGQGVITLERRHRRPHHPSFVGPLPRPPDQVLHLERVLNSSTTLLSIIAISWNTEGPCKVPMLPA